MDMGSPLADVVPGARGQLLASLVQLEAPVTVRALARHARVAPQTALTLVNELTAIGLVSAQRAGQAQLVSLNRLHMLVPPLVALTRSRERLIELLRSELSSWPGIAGAWLLGPVARGDGDRGSVIDLLLVASTSTETPAWGDATGRLVRQVESWTGNRVQLVQHSRGSFALANRGGHPLIEAIRQDGVPLTQGSQSMLRMSG